DLRFFARFLTLDPFLVCSGLRLVAVHADSRNISRIQNEVMREAFQWHFFSTGINAMFSMFFVPFRDAGGLVHVLDDLPPADSGVVRTERDFPELGGIRNDAHLRPAEVVIEEVLEPHSGNEEEVPGILPACLDVLSRPVAANFSIALSG